MTGARERFAKLAEKWFLTEPAYFAVFCTHALTSNPRIGCNLRVGQGRLEYNLEAIESLTDEAFEECVRIEMLRIMLKHPYERKPAGTSCRDMYMASDMVLSSHYSFIHANLMHPQFFNLPKRKHYEWYLANIPQENLVGREVSEKGDDEISFSPDYYSDAAALWEEDEGRQLDINETIRRIEQWGSVPGTLVEEIEASTKARIDYRKVLKGFRASILSSKRRLTRMRPNRRRDFEQMGSKYDFSTRLLVAVDVSSSVESEMLVHFYSVIIKFFSYGIENVDVLQFDSELKGDVESLVRTRRKRHFEIRGRGGTSFQPIFDYISETPQYDGLIILTDGFAEIPEKHFGTRAKVVWGCTDESTYDMHREWMTKLGRCCYINL